MEALIVTLVSVLLGGAIFGLAWMRRRNQYRKLIPKDWEEQLWTKIYKDDA